MIRKRRLLIILFLLLTEVTIFSSCQEKQYRYDDIIQIPSEDMVMSVKISYPEKWTHKNKIIIWSCPPLSDQFLPDSGVHKRNVWISPILRKTLLDSGYVNIEYIERSDSVEYFRRKYRNSDSNTKATDLENLLGYINTTKSLKNKKIILIGHSEGGDVNVNVASRRQPEISALVQLACSALSGRELIEYQSKTQLFERILILTRHGHQDLMDKTTNRVSSLDSYHTADSEGKGTMQFIKENLEPLDSIVLRYKTKDSVYHYVDLYLKERWKQESNDAKSFSLNNFEIYYNFFAGSLTPHQITLKTYDPAKYYPFVKCPVLAVHGTEDERIECYPNLERMEQLLLEGGNSDFDKIVLEGVRHSLAKRKGGAYVVEKEVLDQIIKWIGKQ